MLEEPIRVLFVVGGVMHRGGIESFIMNYFRYIDSRKVKIDFVVHGYEAGIYDDEILASNATIYHVPVKSKKLIANFLALFEIMKKHKYTIVHAHMDAMSFFPLLIAKICGVPVRIAHSHNTRHMTNSKLKHWINEITRNQLPLVATDLYACSNAAGNWLFKSRKEKTFELIPNAVTIENYSFNPQKRRRLREFLNIPESAKVYGHIGRFDYQKNQTFLVDVFKQINEIICDSHLVMIGSGIDKDAIVNKVKTMQIENIHFVESCDNANEYYSVFDVFLFPSHFEGLGMVLVEASINGLPCVAADTIPKEVNIAGNTTFLSLKCNKQKWATEAISMLNVGRQQSCEKEIVSAGYRIEDAALALQNKYLLLGVE